MEAKGWKRQGHSQGQAMKGQGHAPLPSPPPSSFTSPPNSSNSCSLFLLLFLFRPLSILSFTYPFCNFAFGGGGVVSPSLTPFTTEYPEQLARQKTSLQWFIIHKIPVSVSACT